MINKLKVGTVYEILDDELKILCQVGVGGDCGVFLCRDGDVESCIDRGDIAFRVVIVENDLKKKWKKIGVLKLPSILQSPQIYVEKETFPDAWYLVNLTDFSAREKTTKEISDSYELLSAWATEHVLARVRGKKFF